MKKVLQVISWMFFIIIIPLNGHATRYYLDASAPDLLDGLSWANAFNELEDLAAVMQSGDEAWIKIGVYSLETGIRLEHGVQLYGGFIGNEGSLAERNLSIGKTIFYKDSRDLIGNSAGIVFGTEPYNGTNIIDGIHFETPYHCAFGNAFLGESQIDFYFYNSSITGVVSIEAGTNGEVVNCLLINNSDITQLIFASESLVVRNNTFINLNKSLLIEPQNSEVSIEFSNNIVIGDSIELVNYNSLANPGVENKGENITSLVVRNNVISEGIEINVEPIIPVQVIEDNIFISDPEDVFENFTQGDYTLNSCSPAIDQGINLINQLDIDLNGANRVEGVSIDAGCYESNFTNIIYVDIDASGTNDGSSWADAYTSLHDACFNANPCSEIWVAEGTYYVNDALPLPLKPFFKLYGGFNGTESAVTARNYHVNPTIISGDYPGSTASDNANFLFYGFGLEDQASMVIDGFTIEDIGDVNSQNHIIEGFVLNNIYADVTIRNTILKNNNNSLIATTGNLNVDNCLIYDNTTANPFIQLSGATRLADISHSTFVDNAFDAALSVNYWAKVTNSIFEGNAVTDVLFQASSATILDIVHTNVDALTFQFGNSLDQSTIYAFDPKFINPNGNNFRLSKCSPLIDLGMENPGIQSFDLDQNPRPISLPDLGCYESNYPVNRVIYVDQGATGTNNGTSWLNAYTDIENAFNQAECNDEMWVKQGSYILSNNEVLKVKSGMKIYGGFNGTEGESGQRNWQLYPTELNGIGVVGNFFDDADVLFRVVDADFQDPIEIDGFTIKNFDQDIIDNAIIDATSQADVPINIILRHCKIKNNDNGLIKTKGNVLVDNCLIYENNPTGKFISVDHMDRQILINHCTVVDNTFGNFILEQDLSIISVTNSIFKNNTSSNDLFSVTTTANFIIDHSNFDVLTYSYDGSLDTSDIYFLDPSFVDEVNGNYELMSCSPMIDAGTENINTSDKDLNKAIRVQNTQADLGCYEYSYPALNIVYVNHAATGSNNGTSWPNAYVDLQDAIAQATEGMQIWVAAGTYSPFEDPQNALGTERFVPGCGVSLYGGFLGNETSLSQRIISDHETTLSGRDAFGNSVAYHIMRLVDFQAGAEVDGFTFEGGNADAAAAGVKNGGAIWVTRSQGKINNCTFKNNKGVDGGALFIDDSPKADVRNCVFESNEASEKGGAIYSQNSNLISRNNFFKQNFSLGNGVGGAIFFKEGQLNISNNVFDKNFAVRAGAIAIDQGSDVDITFSTFYKNSAITTNEGGAIKILLNNVCSIENSIFYENEAGGNVNHFEGQTQLITINHSIVEGGWTGTGIINADPLFTDVLNSNFIPTTCSPAIDQAVGTDFPVVDVRKASRIIGEGADLGAYEQKFPVYLDEELSDLKQVCNNTPFVLEYPVSQIDSFYTEFNGTEMNSGVMFDVEMHRTVELEKVFYHKECMTNSLNQIYYKEGSYVGSETFSGDWNLIYNVTDLGTTPCTQGDTSLATIDTDVLLEAGRRYAFYVVNITTGTSNNIYSSNDPTAAFGDTMTSNEIMTVFHGRGTNNQPFQTLTAFSRQFEGGFLVTNYDSIYWYENGVFLGEGSSINISGVPAGPNYFEPQKFLPNGCSFSDTLTVQGIVGVTNDECIDATLIDITSGSPEEGNNFIVGQNFCATSSGTTSSCNTVSNKDVWYKIIGPSTGRIQLEVRPFAAIENFNVKASLYEGTCGNLTEIYCADQVGSNETEFLDVTGLIPGQIYYLNIDGAGGQKGSFDIYWEDPCENIYQDATPLQDMTGGCVGDNITLTPEIKLQDTLHTHRITIDNRNGLAFDIVAREPVKVKRISSRLAPTPGIQYELYYRLGSGIELTDVMTEWTYAGSHTFGSAPIDIYEIPIDLDVVLDSGDTLGIYLFTNNLAAPIYFNTASNANIGNEVNFNGQISILSNTYTVYPPFSTNANPTASWLDGNIIYERVNFLQWRKNGSIYSQDLEISPPAVDGDIYQLRMRAHNDCWYSDTTTIRTEGKIVRNTKNEGWRSLRSVVGCASGGDSLYIHTSLADSTIRLSQEIKVNTKYGNTGEIYLFGLNNPGDVIISGSGGRIFNVIPGSLNTHLFLKNLTLEKGIGINGGQIRNQASLTMEQVILRNGLSIQNTNIYNEGNLTMKNVELRAHPFLPNQHLTNYGNITVLGQVRLIE